MSDDRRLFISTTGIQAKTVAFGLCTDLPKRVEACLAIRLSGRYQEPRTYLLRARPKLINMGYG
ncbi:hypothetical protein BC1002_7098 (plasmid) [Paraburkholderia atlantica]|uniref:Uncharacterized protein n=1 Tax=Paraburkholderia atlantica TaxID=2654982 RepID=D5WNH1_PARAM|nr:hypothetical protein BC1002_7098 [Paraburkholderia atlantica]